MTTFQKFLLVSIFLFGLSSLFLFSQFLKNQEQIEKDELKLQQTQKEISDCKYLLANKDLLLKDEEESLKLSKPITDPKYSEEVRDKSQQVWEKVWNEYQAALNQYDESAANCRDLIRNLGSF